MNDNILDLIEEYETKFVYEREKDETLLHVNFMTIIWINASCNNVSTVIEK